MKLNPGCEYPPGDEQVFIDKMITDLQNQLKRLYPDGNTLRQTHPKMHGCVKAEFTVLDNIDDDLKVGIFKEARTYPAYIRFSNANTEIKHDVKKDVRGMAIKILNVEGEKLMSAPRYADMQDFVLIDNEVFMSKNVEEFHKLIHAFTSSKLSFAFFLLNPMHFPLVLRLAKSQKTCHHVLDTEYWSTTPYLYGDGKAVKYHVQPASETPVQGGIVKSDENYLRSNMKKTLSDHDVYFDFCIQLQTDPELMPVEDPTVKWNSPYIKVARIKIPKQVFDTEELEHMGEDFSFSPWHGKIEHRPIGGLNRARKRIYEAMSEFWHDRNDAYKN